jgi:hypothetical protein
MCAKGELPCDSPVQKRNPFGCCWVFFLFLDAACGRSEWKFEKNLHVEPGESPRTPEIQPQMRWHHHRFCTLLLPVLLACRCSLQHI